MTETVLRRDIAQLSGSGPSLMPERRESAVSIEQMGDLLALLLLPQWPHSNEDHREIAIGSKLGIDGRRNSPREGFKRP